MGKSDRNIVLMAISLCGIWPMGGRRTGGRSRVEPAARGGTSANLPGSFPRLGLSTMPAFFDSMGGYPQGAGTGNLHDVAASLTAQDPFVLFLIGVALATLGAIGLRRFAKSASGIAAGRKATTDEMPDRRPDSE